MLPGAGELGAAVQASGAWGPGNLPGPLSHEHPDSDSAGSEGATSSGSSAGSVVSDCKGSAAALRRTQRDADDDAWGWFAETGDDEPLVVSTGLFDRF